RCCSNPNGTHGHNNRTMALHSWNWGIELHRDYSGCGRYLGCLPHHRSWDSPAEAADSQVSTANEYNELIRLAAQKYLPGYDWRLYKAQLWQESKLNPYATSPAGAKGIAQFMPATWAEWS